MTYKGWNITLMSRSFFDDELHIGSLCKEGDEAYKCMIGIHTGENKIGFLVYSYSGDKNNLENIEIILEIPVKCNLTIYLLGNETEISDDRPKGYAFYRDFVQSINNDIDELLQRLLVEILL